MTYEQAIAVDPNAPVEDIFANVDVQFRPLAGGPNFAGLDGDLFTVFEFFQDTDNPRIPEPASMALLVTGALSLTRRPRRR